jgi:hypothetical protein
MRECMEEATSYKFIVKQETGAEARQ